MIDIIILIIMTVAAACIAVMQWAAGNRYRDTLWAWMCGYWFLQVIRDIMEIISKAHTTIP